MIDYVQERAEYEEGRLRDIVDAQKERIAQLEQENTELRAKLNNRKKLTRREVDEMRRLRRTASLSYDELGEIFKVNPSTAYRTVRGIYHS